MNYGESLKNEYISGEITMKFIVNGQFAFYAEGILSSKAYYVEYLNGEINSAGFRKAMLADKSLEEVAGFSKDRIARIALTPPDEKLPAETITKHLVNNNIIPPCENRYDGFDEYRKHIRGSFNHGEFITFIYPEDEGLLYAMANIAQPKRVFVAGSYYGYFAIWAMKAIAEQGGMCVLSDIDAQVCALAKENFEALGFGEHAEITCKDSEKLLLNRTEPIDMLVLDATGKRDDPRREYRGKRIYGALLKDAKRLLREGSVIVIHNMEPEDRDMRVLVNELKAMNALGTSYDTFNGLGVYVLV